MKILLGQEILAILKISRIITATRLNSTHQSASSSIPFSKAVYYLHIIHFLSM